MADRQVLVSLTTYINMDKKIRDLGKHKITEIALFLSMLDHKNRQKTYKKLERIGIKSIPHVHARTDMEKGELEFLMKKFKTKAFNIHPSADFPLIYDYGRLKKKIFIENVAVLPTPRETEVFGGLCLDFAHMENDRLVDKEKYGRMVRLAGRFKIGCCHVSAILKKKKSFKGGKPCYDFHYYKSLSEFDYLKRYKRYFPKYMSLELENSIAEQLKAREYIKKFI